MRLDTAIRRLLRHLVETEAWERPEQFFGKKKS